MTDSKREAWDALAQAVADDDGSDYGWIDELPDVDELPDGPDDTQAVMFPVKPPRV
jgi:hypothetical protein